MSLSDTADFGFLRLIVQDPEKAKKELEANDFIVKIKNIIGIKLSNSPGGFVIVLKVLNDNKINLEYIYAFTHEKSEKAILLLQANDLDGLIKILQENHIKVVPPSEVYNL